MLSTLGGRAVALAVLLVLEAIVISIWLDTDRLSTSGVVTRIIIRFGPWVVRSGIAFLGLFLLFAWLSARTTATPIRPAHTLPPLRWWLFSLHALAMATFAMASQALFTAPPNAGPQNGLAVAWMGCGFASCTLAAFALAPLKDWIVVFRETGSAAIYAGIAAALAAGLTALMDRLWIHATRVTFVLVETILHLFLNQTIADPGHATIGSSTFRVEVAPQCSGLEGVGLMLVFGSLWLWMFRAEFRFPRALLFLPAGMVAAFLLNSVRIAALILLGNAGAEAIALGGFHSQAGWIAFTCTALAFSVLSRKIAWISSHPAEPAAPAPDAGGHDNPAAPYLVPFLAILAASMISRAATGRFEWLYPLRVLSGSATLLWFRNRYRKLDWRFGWEAVAAGTVVFVMWIALDRLSPPARATLVPAHGAAWIAWVIFRVVGATVTVPAAEELAFRGFLMRRIVSADFESVDFRKTGLLAMAVSSIAFGLMHGGRWFAGIAAGLLYALVLQRRGRIGDAIAAHATTNALLAIWVLTRSDWSLW